MSEIKVSVSITLPGGVMLTQAEAEQLEKEKAGMGFDAFNLKVEDKVYNEKAKKEVIKPVVIHFKTRKCRTVRRSVNLCTEAYKFMRSTEGIVPPYKMWQWRNMSPDARLEANLKRLCEGFGGISYTYKVFDD